MPAKRTPRRLTIDNGPEYLEHVGRHVQDAWQLMEELSTESDRAAAVLGGAYLDELLGGLLRERLDISDLSLSKKERERLEGLWQPSGALGSFATRISLCLLMEVIPVNLYRSLWFVRDIRNAFAHKRTAKSFDDQAIGSLVDALWIEVSKGKNWKKPASRRDTFLRSITDVAHLTVMTVRHPMGRDVVQSERGPG